MKTDVGDKNVYESMSRNGYRIGGEQTGHIIFSKYGTTGDGVLTSLKVMQVMIARKKKLSELASAFTDYPQVQINVKVKDKERIMNSPAVIKELDKVQKALGGNGSMLVRPSGTEPVIRIGIEAPTQEEARHYAEAVQSAILSAADA